MKQKTQGTRRENSAKMSDTHLGIQLVKHTHWQHSLMGLTFEMFLILISYSVKGMQNEFINDEMVKGEIRLLKI